MLNVHANFSRKLENIDLIDQFNVNLIMITIIILIINEFEHVFLIIKRNAQTFFVFDVINQIVFDKKVDFCMFIIIALMTYSQTLKHLDKFDLF